MWEEWAKTITDDKESYTSKFPVIYKLLLKWRDRLEYSLVDIRCPTKAHQGFVNFSQDKRNKKTYGLGLTSHSVSSGMESTTSAILRLQSIIGGSKYGRQNTRRLHV